MTPGTKVEVRTGFDRSWAPGFEIVDLDDDGYLVRRLSDGAQLPKPFSEQDVRAQRRDHNMWWL